MTSRWNLILLCEAHHSVAHNGDWVVVLLAPGQIAVRRRLPGEPLYEIRFEAPPAADVHQAPDVNTKLRAAAARARIGGAA